MTSQRTITLSVRLSPEEDNYLREEARRADRSVGYIVRRKLFPQSRETSSAQSAQIIVDEAEKVSPELAKQLRETSTYQEAVADAAGNQTSTTSPEAMKSQIEGAYLNQPPGKTAQQRRDEILAGVNAKPRGRK